MIETITKQQNVVNDLRDSLEQYLSSEVSEGTWYNIEKTILETIQNHQDSLDIFCSSIIYQRPCSDLIIEYDIDWREGYYLYTHLRKNRLQINICKKEEF